ncbi:MAG: hypothetical protein ACHQ4H_12660 [Ktedonobacterales bacterium]
MIWIVRSTGAGSQIEVDGTEMFPAAGTFHQAFAESAWQMGNYPSVVNVPSPGCWQLTATTGTVSGVMTFWVESGSK